MKSIRVLPLVVLCVFALDVRADDAARPNEAELFGKPSESKDAFASGEATDNPLQVGGTYYQRSLISAQDGVLLKNLSLSAPLQFDGFLDARPNDRLRGFIDARLLYDPTGRNTTTSVASPTSLSATSAASPQVVLDQAWLKFDLDRKVFVTVGKQHLRWGVGRFWNPTDVLSTQRRDPLIPVDLRLGNYMAKFHVPLEAQNANFYVVGLFDNPQPASSLGQVGGAVRAETAIGNAEVGIDATFRGGRTPLYGADISTGLGPFDVFCEVAVITGSTYLYEIPSSISAGADLSSVMTTKEIKAPQFQSSLGLNYQFAWKENRQATIGVEYFYNQIGNASPNIYPALILLGEYRPFYLGKQYAAVYLMLEGPDEQKKTSYTFSALSNLTDGSVIGRLDFSLRFLTHLTFEAFVSGHFGTSGGEFKFRLDTPAITYLGQNIAAMAVPASTYDLGVGFRMSF